MSIEWDPDARHWHLRNHHLSLVLAVLDSGELGQLYLGPTLAPGVDYRHLARGGFTGWDNRVGDAVRLELPTPDTGDYRQPALEVVFADGSRATHMCYIGHRMTPGKPGLPGLPST
jgi:alpha-galactosidase